MQIMICGKGKLTALLLNPQRMIHPILLVNTKFSGLTWLIQSMESQVAKIYLLYPTTKSIWDFVMMAFSNLEGCSRMLSVQTCARNLYQETNSVTTYFH